MSFARIETALIERLESGIPNLRGVLSGDDLAALAEKGPPTPCLCVLLQDYQVIDTRSDGRMAQVRQTWIVVAVVKSVAPGLAGGAAIRQARLRAGTLLDAVAHLLMGFRPDGGDGPLLLATAPPPLFQEGTAYLALAFAIDTYFKGEAP